MVVLWTVAAGILGAILASFMVAQVWRLRLRQLKSDEEYYKKLKTVKAPSALETEELDWLKETAKERKEGLARLKPLEPKKGQPGRSHCLSCGHQLAWYDLIPVFSWLVRLGKCGYCKKPIGWTEFLAEISLALLFGVSVWWWMTQIATPGVLDAVQLALWLPALVILVGLFIYDLRWQLLPDVLTFPLAALGFIYALIELARADWSLNTFASLGMALVILSGIYFLLAFKKWSGLGDAKLGLGLALFVFDWKLAFVTLALANFMGTLIVLPAMAARKITMKSRVPFGPLLIAAFLLTMLFSEAINQIISQYFVIF